MVEYENAYNIWRKIEEYDNIALLGHVNPDGDCVSSVRAMKALITKYFPNKKVYVSGSVPFNLVNLCYKSDDLSDIKKLKN